FAEGVGCPGLLAIANTDLSAFPACCAEGVDAVVDLENKAVSAASGVEMIERYWILGRVDRLEEVWRDWEAWFVQVEESHSSFPALVFFRSPQPDHCWVTAAGAVLDAGSLISSTVDVARRVRAEVCLEH